MRKLNPDIHKLGRLCLHGHEFENTGKSLRYIKTRHCVICHGNRVRSWDKRHPEKRKQIYNKWLRLNPKRRQEIYANFREERKAAVKMVRKLVDHQIKQELYENLIAFG